MIKLIILYDFKNSVNMTNDAPPVTDGAIPVTQNYKVQRDRVRPAHINQRERERERERERMFNIIG